jgi:hypothetical protein
MPGHRERHPGKATPQHKNYSPPNRAPLMPVMVAVLVVLVALGVDVTKLFPRLSGLAAVLPMAVDRLVKFLLLLFNSLPAVSIVVTRQGGSAGNQDRTQQQSKTQQ